MANARRYLMMFGSSFALSGILILSLMGRCRCRKGLVAGTGNDLHEKLRDSKIALDKAASAVQNALDDLDHDVGGNRN